MAQLINYFAPCNEREAKILEWLSYNKILEWLSYNIPRSLIMRQYIRTRYEKLRHQGLHVQEALLKVCFAFSISLPDVWWKTRT